MLAELNSASTLGAIVPLPFILTLVIAVTVLVGISIAVRRLRTAGTLTLAHATTSAAAASFVIAAALLAVVATGTVYPAMAAQANSPAVSDSMTPPAVGFQPIVIENLEGYQLPTK